MGKWLDTVLLLKVTPNCSLAFPKHYTSLNMLYIYQEMELGSSES